MRFVLFGRVLFIVILSWMAFVVSGGVGAADQVDVQTVRQKAEQGDAEAQFTLGQMYAKGQVVKRDYAQARQWYQKAAEQGHADAQKALDNLNNGQTAKPSKESTGTSNENSALAQAGIPPIPSSDDAWVSVGKSYNKERGYLEEYIAPSTIVHTGKPNGFKVWYKIDVAAVAGTLYQYRQFDCGREATRILAFKGKDFSGENFGIKTNLWSKAAADNDGTFDKILLNYCE